MPTQPSKFRWRRPRGSRWITAAYTGALKLLEGVYALVEAAPSEDFTDCQQHPTLTQIFMEEYLAESENFIFDTDMEDVPGVLMDEGQ